MQLEELKQQQPYAYMGQNKRSTGRTEKPAAVVASASPTSTPNHTETPFGAKSATVGPSSSKSDSIDLQKFPVASITGQKEVAMLRPPSAKSHYLQIDEAEEPKIVAQRSSSNDKPSAYDRLRKVLSLDDALKKVSQLC